MKKKIGDLGVQGEVFEGEREVFEEERREKENREERGKEKGAVGDVWESLEKPIMILAPMEGVTDVVFRQVVAEAGRPDLFFTEFTNVSSFASEKGRENALERLEIAPTYAPIIAQIWGKNPEHFSQLASALQIRGFAGVDLNFGCPDRHVNKAGGGAAMIRTPELAVDCLRRAKAAAGELPVSVKTRLGFTFVDEYKEWLPTLLREKPAALTVHLRTRKEMSKVGAHYELVPEILQMRAEIAPEAKLVLNGDIKDVAEAEKLHEKYPEVDGFMIGRGVFENPFCFRKTESGEAYRGTREELIGLLRLHLELFDRENEKREREGKKTPSFEPLKHYFKIYVRDFEGSKEMRAKMMEAKTTGEVRGVLEAFGA